MQRMMIAAVITLLVCGVTTAATINVPADYTTIQAAVDAASNGDEILVAPGTYTDTQDGHVVDMKGKAITLRSTGGAAVTIIDGQGARRGIACFSGETAETVIEGFTITNGEAVAFDYSGDAAGGVWVDWGGGGLCCYQSNPTLLGCAISYNAASGGYGTGGGVYSVGCNVTIRHCTIMNNSAAWFGGGIVCSTQSTITDSTIAENAARYKGGGIVVYGHDGSAVISECEVARNIVTEGGGGGIYCSSGGPAFRNCKITGNTASWSGGGVLCRGSSPVLDRCTVSGNTTSSGWGGGIYCYDNSSASISGCTISDNTASSSYGSGGGIANDETSPFTVSGSTISHNICGQTGGGIHCSEGSDGVIIHDCRVVANTAAVAGGGIMSVYTYPMLGQTVVCGNAPSQTHGSWYTDYGNNCIEDNCDDCEFELPDEPPGQDEEPEYGEEDIPTGGNKLVIVTHGIMTGEYDFLNGGWGTQMINGIDQQVGNEWSVYAYYTGWWFEPWGFATIAAMHGAAIGTSAVDLGFEHVHLIGHSAGAYFVDACANRIKDLSPETTVHVTFLDPASMVPVFDRVNRGSSADYAENYFSRQKDDPLCGVGDWLSAAFTQETYDNCFNIDVSQLDPDYDDEGWIHCLSSHQWPHCFYRLSADADVSSDAECDVINGEYTPYGFGLARENFNSEQNWLDVVSQFPEGNDPALELPEDPGFRGGSSGGDADYISFDRLDDPLDLTEWTIVTGGSVTTTNSGVTLSASGVGAASWINVELIPTKPTNIVQLHLAPGAVGEAVGMTTVLLDGEQIGIVDERHMPGEGDTFVFGTQRIAPPDETLILSIRLDTIYADGASMTASSIRTGLSDIRWHCLADLASGNPEQGDMDGVVDHADLDVILGEWGTFCAADCAQSACPGDIDFDCRVGVLDLLELLMSWGDCE